MCNELITIVHLTMWPETIINHIDGGIATRKDCSVNFAHKAAATNSAKGPHPSGRIRASSAALPAHGACVRNRHRK
jgi:hypothetical protein